MYQSRYKEGDETHECTRCEQTLPIEAFSPRRDGSRKRMTEHERESRLIGQPSSWCKACTAEYNREQRGETTYQRRKREVLSRMGDRHCELCQDPRVVGLFAPAHNENLGKTTYCERMTGNTKSFQWMLERSIPLCQSCLKEQRG